MNEKTYTAAEVEMLLAAERAKSAKPTKVAWKTGVSTKTKKPFAGLQVSGDFFPVYLTPKAAEGVLSVSDQIKALILQGPPKVEEAKAKDSLAPRIATKA